MTVIIPKPEGAASFIDAPEVVAVTLSNTTINRSKAKRLLDAAVRDRGAGHVQNVCTYGASASEVEENSLSVVPRKENVERPSCLVGYVLWLLLGTEAFTAAIKSEVFGNGATFESIDHLIPGYTFTSAARRLLWMAQSLQDGRGGHGDGGHVPWGEAVSIAWALSTPLSEEEAEQTGDH